jgi:16S rRNA (uracil1498-N3)-methyltransferase
MKRFILNSEPDRNGTIRITGRDYHYLVRVRRLAPGENFPALLASGASAVVHVDSVDNGVLCGTVLPGIDSITDSVAARSLPRLILYQALPRGDKMDLIVRQAAEAGVAEIVPFVSEYSVPALKPRENTRNSNFSELKVTRWQRIIKEARQQSGSVVETVINAPVHFSELFTAWEKLRTRGAAGLLLHQIPLEQASLHGYLDNKPTVVAAAIGPEGGFSPSEVSGFLEAGFKPLTVGASVLRTETAAVYAVAAIQIILQEYNSWKIQP